MKSNMLRFWLTELDTVSEIRVCVGVYVGMSDWQIGGTTERYFVSLFLSLLLGAMWQIAVTQLPFGMQFSCFFRRWGGGANKLRKEFV